MVAKHLQFLFISIHFYPFQQSFSGNHGVTIAAYLGLLVS